MFFITRYNFKIVISILIFTFYIINQVTNFNFHITRLVLQIFLNKSDITEVSEQPKCQLSALNVMAIRIQRHENVSKQTTLLAGDDVTPPIGAA